MRLIGMLLVLLLAAVVAAGFKHGFTAMHFKMGAVLAAMAVVAVMPTTRKPAKQQATTGR